MADVQQSALTSSALAYAEGGLSVFPLHSVTLAGGCTCGYADCKSPAKHPRTQHGVDDATTDRNEIKSWWDRWPNANIGVATAAPGLYVIDIDGERGAASWRDLCDEHGGEPATRTVRTGNGRHLWFITDTELGNSASRLAPGVDTRGRGGYVVAPPSVHIAGGGTMYAWENPGSPLSKLPQWIIDRLAEPARLTPTASTWTGGIDETARKRLTAVCGTVAMAGEGERNNTLNWAAHTLGRLVAAHRLDEALVRENLTVAANRAGLEHREATKTITSGLTAGLKDPDYDGMSGPVPATTVLTMPNVTIDVTDPQTPAERPVGPWTPVDLDPHVTGTYTAPVGIALTRDDGTSLLYPETTNAIFGESESGKSWVALYAAAQLLNARRGVLYIDFESTAAVIVHRLMLLGVPTDAIVDHLGYVSPSAGLDMAAIQDITAALYRYTPTLAVLDGVTGAMGMHGLDPLSNSDAETWDRMLPRKLAEEAGLAVVSIDHVPKSRDAGTKFAIGGQHKLASISGAAYRADVIKTLAPKRAGSLKLTISKDRLGSIRASHPSQAGIFHLDSTDPEHAVARLDAPADADKPFRPTHLMEKVSRVLEYAAEPMVKDAIRREVPSKREHVTAAIECLITEGYVEVVKAVGNSQPCRSIRPYRDEEIA